MKTTDTRILRLLDANLNRCREGIRVLEDVARFFCDDQDLMPKFKALRNELLAAQGELPDIAELIASRDTPGDVGTGVTSQSELDRKSVRDLVLANARRSAEAVRVLEEVSKLVSPLASQRFKALRYKMYDLERELVIKVNSD